MNGTIPRSERKAINEWLLGGTHVRTSWHEGKGITHVLVTGLDSHEVVAQLYYQLQWTWNVCGALGRPGKRARLGVIAYTHSMNARYHQAQFYVFNARRWGVYSRVAHAMRAAGFVTTR